MDSISNFIKAQINDSEYKPARITFYSSTYFKDNAPATAAITVMVEDGDFLGILEVVKENGGIWSEDMAVFIPYPCACVEIKKS